MHLDVFDIHLVGVVNLVGNKRARKIWECQGTEEWRNRVGHLTVGDNKEQQEKDSFAGGKEQEKNRRSWIEAKYVHQYFLAQSKKRRFSDASVLTLASFITGLAVKKKWEELLSCLLAAENGERRVGNEGVDLMAVAPWTILYNIRDKKN